MSRAFSNLGPGRPSVTAAAKAKLMDDIRDVTPAEPTKRVNFDVPHSLHLKLKMNAAKRDKTIREFLTEYISQLPEV